MTSNYLLDKDFLKALDLQKDKTTYAKITLLTFNEEPIYEAQGVITQGSVNVDGASAVRRTCSLTMVSPTVDIGNVYWALKNKFKLSVGVENIINDKYPDIVWFKQGTFVFTSINMSVSANNYTINLSGKDKMCLLNGEVSGTINASTDFGQLQEETLDEKGEVIINLSDIPIVEIVKNAVQTYAGEPLSNIVINDIENYGLELLEYKAQDTENKNKDMYLLVDADIKSPTKNNVINMNFDGKTKKYYKSKKAAEDKINGTAISLSDDSIVYIDRTNSGLTSSPTILYYPNEQGKILEFTVMKISSGDTVGYRQTALTYPGELVANIGESLVTVLDKIKNMFSNFEYFYDIDGRFVFQKKKTYVNESWNPLQTLTDESYAENAAYVSPTIYQFESSSLITAFNNNPNINNFRNDYSIWGKKKTSSDIEVPIHLRQAIAEKPVKYTSFRYERCVENEIGDKQDLNGNWWKKKKPVTYISSENENISTGDFVVDWREIIYQMALDYYNLSNLSLDSVASVKEYNAELYPTGKTGYEPFYTDIQGFWRQLYYPWFLNIDNDIYYDNFVTLSEKKKVARDYLINDKKLTANEITKVKIEQIINDKEKIKRLLKDYYGKDFIYDINFINNGIKYRKLAFNKNITENPTMLNFWFDFINIENDFGQYSISTIGDRSKAINDDKVNSIFLQETPSILLLSDKEYRQIMSDDEAAKSGYTYIRMPDFMEKYFTISSQSKSAWDELQTQLYQYTNFAESITLTAVPIYYLEPNNRILVKDDNTGINGEYIITKITIPLAYNGTTSITATKAIERIY